EIFAMTVPSVAFGTLRAKPVHLHQSRTGAQEPAPQKDRLAEKVSTVFLPERRAGSREVDRAADRFRADDVECFLLALFQRERGGAFLEVASLVVELLDQLEPALENRAGGVCQQREVFKPKVVAIRVAAGLHRVELAAQGTTPLAGATAAAGVEPAGD